MAETRIPVSKPSADLEQVFDVTVQTPEFKRTTRYRTRFGKVFEREESTSRGLMWYRVVQQVQP